MEKLPHEKLREAAKTEADERNYYPCVVAAKDFGAMDDTRYTTEVKLLNAIAGEIEKYYIPRPRFEDGEPVQDSDLREIGEYAVCCVYMDGSWIFNPDKYEDERNPKPWDEQEGRQCDFIKRPEPKVLDADGVEIKVGDTVFENNSPIPLKVVTVYGDGDISAVGDGGICSKLDSSNYSHREPDSLQKILDDLTAYRENQVANNDTLIKIEFRLAAIMERDA